MFAAPRACRLQLKIKDDIMLFAKLENIFERGNALAAEFAAEPRASIETAQFIQREVVNFAVTVGGAVDGVVMNSNKPRVARKLKIGLDERSAERHGTAECGQCV